MGLVVMIDVTPVPPVPISQGRTVIFDIVGYIIMEWTMPNESRICRICRRVLILNKKKNKHPRHTDAETAIHSSFFI